MFWLSNVIFIVPVDFMDIYGYITGYMSQPVLGDLDFGLLFRYLGFVCP
jgi:uncharacterized membrane protein (DUF485 family)